MEATQLRRGPAPRRRAPRIGFGIYVREARRAMGMNQSAFAALIDVKESTLSAWETGRNNPEGDRAELAELLEERTGYSRAYFMGWGDMPSPDPDTARVTGG